MINKYALAFAALAIAQGSQAQGWITLVDHDGNDVTNSSTDAWEVNPGLPFTMVIHLDATINGGSNRTVGLRRYEMGVSGTSQNYFCWNLCYLPRAAGQTPLWVASDNQAMSPGVTFTGFGGYHIPNGDYSLSNYRFVWYDVNNPTDTAFVDLSFESAVSVGEVASTATFSLSPNPANGFATVSIDTGGADNLAVFNALGAQVLSAPVAATQRNVQLNTAALQEGVYFVTLQQKGRAVVTRRLVVTR